MSIKEYAKEQLKYFFIITTLVNFVMFFLGSRFNHGLQFSYEVLLLPPLYGFFGTLPSWISYSKKELPTKQLFIRKIFQFLALEVLLTLITFPGSYFCKENLDMILSFLLSVFLVYVLVIIISWILDKRSADEMMRELEAYQQSNHDLL